MAFFDERGVAYSYESTVPAPLLPSIDQSYNPPRSYKAPPMADARSVRVTTHCPWEIYFSREIPWHYFLLYMIEMFQNITIELV